MYLLNRMGFGQSGAVADSGDDDDDDEVDGDDDGYDITYMMT